MPKTSRPKDSTQPSRLRLDSALKASSAQKAHLSVAAVSGPAGRDGFVYFLRRNTDNAVKIGWSKEPLERWAYIERRGDVEVDLIANFPAQRFVESELHDRFARYRLDGEWFASHGPLEGAVQLVEILWGGEQ